jgi:sterol carrier protein 2
VVVTAYKRADGNPSEPLANDIVSVNSLLGYNPAVEARGVTLQQAQLVRSKRRSSDWAFAEENRQKRAIAL